MARNQYVVGRDNEEKFKSINTTLNHLARRSNKAVGVFAPPSLISVFVEQPVNGLIHKQLFPVSGTLGNMCCYVENIQGKAANVDIEISLKYPNNTGEKVMVPGKRVVQTAKINKHIPSGTLVSITVVGTDVECSGIWLSGLFTMDLNTAKLHTAIVDELEKSYDRLQEHLSADTGPVEQEKPSTELSELINLVGSTDRPAGT